MMIFTKHMCSDFHLVGPFFFIQSSLHTGHFGRPCPPLTNPAEFVVEVIRETIWEFRIGIGHSPNYQGFGYENGTKS